MLGGQRRLLRRNDVDNWDPMRRRSCRRWVERPRRTALGEETALQWESSWCAQSNGRGGWPAVWELGASRRDAPLEEARGRLFQVQQHMWSVLDFIQSHGKPLKDFKWERFLHSQNGKGIFWHFLLLRLSRRLINQRVVSVRHLDYKPIISNCGCIYIYKICKDSHQLAFGEIWKKADFLLKSYLNQSLLCSTDYICNMWSLNSLLEQTDYTVYLCNNEGNLNSRWF